jgi:hypothetical protein
MLHRGVEAQAIAGKRKSRSRKGQVMLETRPELSISPDKVSFIVVKAREFDLQDLAIDLDDNSDATDATHCSLVPVPGGRSDPAVKELRAFINALTEDEQIDLVALTWLGRGDGGLDEWDDLREEAKRAHNKRTASYLLAKPFLPDHLEEGLSAFGCSCEDF